MDIRWKVRYDPRLTGVERLLLELPKRFDNLRAVMKGPVQELFYNMVTRHWESKGAAFGKRWADLAPSTIAQKLRAGTLHKGPLKATEHLWNALIRKRRADNRLEKIANGVRLNLDVPDTKAVHHQFGTRRMPQRQVIPDPLPRSFRSDVRAVVRSYILTGRVG